MVKNLYDYLAKPDKTIGEHVEDLLYRANILRKLGYIKDIHIYNLLIKACEWHDVGKANKEFLKRVLNPKLHFDETKEIAHNILSVYYLDKNEFEEDTDDYFIVACCILFHHDYCDEASVIGEHSSQINSLLIPEYNCNPDERDLLELDCYLEMQETIIVKGLLHRCDYSASGNYEIEYPNDFLEAGLTQISNVKDIIQPLIEAFFSSPWAYKARLTELGGEYAIPLDVIRTASRWLEEEEAAVNNLADVMDDIEIHPSRLFNLINYIDQELFGEKIVVFTDQIETFNAYYEVFKDAFGDEVTGFAESINRDKAEINIYRFQSDPNCKMLICDRSGGEGRNLQIADYVIHIDLPWNINTIEQRIGRLDRMGRNVKKPVTSVVIHSVDSYEEQLFKFWNDGLNVFCQSLSGLEIIMNDINNKIIESIKTDFEFGLYRLIPELIKEAEEMRETVQREQIFDTAAMRFRPLYLQLEKLLHNYQFNENKLFAETMMSWASLAGFGELKHGANDGFVAFDEHNFSVRSAQNSFLIPPNWDYYMSKKQNEIIIKAQRGLEEETKKNINHNNRTIMGSFDRQVAIKNDYIHFYAPGDEIFDCIVKNAMDSYKGMCTALAAESSINWKGFIYTYSIEPNERLLLDAGMSLYSLGMFRQYLSSAIQVIPVGFSSFSEVSDKMVISEHKRLSQMGYFDCSDSIEHLGRRGKENGFLGIFSKYRASNIDWFRSQYSEEKWESLVEQSSQIAQKKAQTGFKKDSNLLSAKEMVDQILSMKESRKRYYGIEGNESIEELRKQYEIILESLYNPIICLESACFMWLVKK